ncbi:glycosyltransferase [Actinomycetospora flava]|uniref:Glycosyltransferase n=1 Tax=Actinomycetospora flava TaxID=3129232 RepID=A0ABU8M4Z8_9PSEU
MHGPTEFLAPESFDLAKKAQSAAAIACISHYCRNQLIALDPGMEGSKLEIIRMGVDVDTYRPRVMSSTDTHKPRILYVGRLVKEKGVMNLLQALKELADEGVEFEAEIVGAGPLKGDIAAAINDFGLTEYVRLVGPVGQDKLPRLYNWANVFCLPSYAEGVPVVLMEAMSSEIAVLTTSVAGIPELVAHGETGLLVAPGDVSGLTQGLRDLCANAERRVRLGSKARGVVQREFQVRPNAQRLLETVILRGSDNVAPNAGYPASGDQSGLAR